MVDYKTSIGLFGYLTLTFLGFIFPIITLLFSLFQDGLKKLKEKNNQDLAQVGSSIQQTKEEERLNIAALENDLRKIKRLNKQLKRKSSFLDPLAVLKKIFFPILISFLSIEIVLLVPSPLAGYGVYIFIGLILLSLSSFVYTIYSLFVLTNILMEVVVLIDEEKKTKSQEVKEEMKNIIELLNELKTASSTSTTYLDKVYLKINSDIIKKSNSVRLEFKNAVKQGIKLSIINSETKMAKNVVAGVGFPEQFIIEAPSSYGITKTEDGQILRRSFDMIWAKTDRLAGEIFITPLKPGSYKINVFISAENVEIKNNSITILVS